MGWYCWNEFPDTFQLQVFLLDCQKGTSASIDYEVEEDRSYIFLIYPPNHEKSANPDLIVTRFVYTCTQESFKRLTSNILAPCTCIVGLY